MAEALKPAVRPPVVSLMGATFDTGNLGVSALASGTLSAIRQGMPGASVSLLDYGTPPLSWTHDGEARVRQVNLRFSKRAWLPNNIALLLLLALLVRIVPVRAWRSWLARRNSWLRRISEADLHLSLAGGDSFSDIYGLRRLTYMALPQILVLLLEKPLVLLPQTYGPFKSRTSRALARVILRRARAIYSRDREGLGVVNGMLRGRGPRPRLAYDMGFGLDPAPPPPKTIARLAELKMAGPLVGLNVSGLLYIGGYQGGNAFGLESDYADLIDALVELMAGEHRTQVLLVPHVYSEGPGSECDLAACTRIAEDASRRHSRHLHLLEGRFDHRQTKHIIGQCEFFVGSRMHACIAAVSQCVPTVGLAYSRKFAGVMELVGEGAAVADLRVMDTGDILAAVDAAWRRREAMRDNLAEHMPAIRQAMPGLFRQPEFRTVLENPLP